MNKEYKKYYVETAQRLIDNGAASAWLISSAMLDCLEQARAKETSEYAVFTGRHTFEDGRFVVVGHTYNAKGFLTCMNLYKDESTMLDMCVVKRSDLKEFANAQA